MTRKVYGCHWTVVVLLAVGLALLAVPGQAIVVDNPRGFATVDLEGVGAKLSLAGQTNLTGNTDATCVSLSPAVDTGQSIQVAITYRDRYGADQSTSQSLAMSVSSSFHDWFTYTTGTVTTAVTCTIKVKVSSSSCTGGDAWLIQFQESCQ